MSRADQFEPGRFFAVRKPGFGWGCRHTSGDDAPADWTDDEGLEVHNVDRCQEQFEVYDGAGSWKPDPDSFRLALERQARDHRDAVLARDPALWPDTSNHDEMGHHLIRHLGHIHVAHRAVIGRLRDAATMEQLGHVDITAGYPAHEDQAQ